MDLAAKLSQKQILPTPWGKTKNKLNLHFMEKTSKEMVGIDIADDTNLML